MNEHELRRRVVPLKRELDQSYPDAPAERKKIEIFRRGILNYWQKHGRHNLPWRNTADPWKILLVEVLLRKTTALQAERIYTSFSTLTPEAVASMPLRKLQMLLKPLGLYRVRAKQLREVSRKVIRAGEKALADPEFLQSLPGIGRYIQNSILCVSFGVPKPALDTNMIRVISRVFNVQTQRSRAREDRLLWQYAESLVPKNKCREYNWGILDLAAEICTARQPKCPQCPLQNICIYAQTVEFDSAPKYGKTRT